MDGVLSQEEINALLNNPGASSDTAEGQLSDSEKDTIGEIANIRILLPSNPTVNPIRINTHGRSYAFTTSSQFAMVTTGVDISTLRFTSENNVVAAVPILILKEHDVKVITDLMMGGDGTNTDVELGELHFSAISEAMNQMMGLQLLHYHPC